MKLIQIFALAAALAVTAVAQEQTSSSQKKTDAPAQSKATDAQKKKSDKGDKAAAGKDSQKPSATTPIQVTVPKSATAKTAAAKPGAATPAAAKPTATKPTVAIGNGAAQPKIVSKPSGATATKTAPATATAKPVAVAKPVVASKPAPTVAVTPKASMPAAAKPGSTTATTKVPVIAVTPQAASGPAHKGAAAAKDTASKPKVSVQPVAKTPFAPKTAKPGPVVAKTAAGPKKSEPKVVEPKTAADAVLKPAAKTASKVGANGRRDPFINPVRTVNSAPMGPNCSTGKKCLFIPELMVQGTVKDNSTGEMVAVVVNRAHHTYFLRQNDQVFNGNVEKITSDSVIFKEFATDTLGHESAHEVVKRVGPVS